MTTDVAVLVIDNLDVWTTAVERRSVAGRGIQKGYKPYGVDCLRALILDLAATGKLVPGEKIEAQKLGPKVDLVMGQAPPGNQCNTDGIGTVFVKTGEFGERFPEVREWTTKPLKMAKSGDVLICVVGATIGKLNLGIDCAIGRSVAAIRPKANLLTEFLYYSLMPFTLRLRKESRGSAQGVIGKSELNSVLIRIPHVSEQQRIVAKVDELLALCDALEKESATAMAAHQALVEALLSTLIVSASAAELATNWARLELHFNTLLTTEASVDALKQTVLKLAVRGKLSAQSRTDEPASKFLTAIRAHNVRRNNEGRGRLPEASIPISQKDQPFRLPAGWIFVRFVDVLINRDAERVPISSDVRMSRKGEYDYYGASGVIDNIDDYLFDESLLLIGEDGANLINRSTPIAFIATGKYWVNNHAHVLEAMSLALLRYLEIYINATDLEPYVTGTAQPKMNQAKMNSIVIALPPADEVDRIVAKVDELVTLCDALKANITDVAFTQRALADAIVEVEAA